MRIGISIDGQWQQMTGVQHYTDSLLQALYACNSEHDISAVAPSLNSPHLLEYYARDGRFAWRNHPRARIDAMGSDLRLAAKPPFAGNPVLQVVADQVDARLLRPWKVLSARFRMGVGSRRYDLLHMPSAGVRLCRTRHNTCTIYDLTTRLFPAAHDAHNIGIWEQLFAYCKRYCSRILAISESTKRDIIEHLGIAADRIDVTPLAPRVGTGRIEDADQRRALLLPFDLADTPFVLYAGTLESRKNLDRLVEAFALAVGEARLPDHKLVLTGKSWNQYDQDLRLLGRELGLGERVITTGYVRHDEMNALMSACDAFAYISNYEGFGLPPLEAMVCGAPVIVSNTSSLPEVVGEAGIQVSPSDAREVAAALHRLLTDPEENARRRALCVEHAKQFTWERTAALTLRSYEAAVA